MRPIKVHLSGKMREVPDSEMRRVVGGAKSSWQNWSHASEKGKANEKSSVWEQCDPNQWIPCGPDPDPDPLPGPIG